MKNEELILKVRVDKQGQKRLTIPKENEIKGDDYVYVKKKGEEQ